MECFQNYDVGYGMWKSVSKNAYIIGENHEVVVNDMKIKPSVCVYVLKKGWIIESMSLLFCLVYHKKWLAPMVDTVVCGMQDQGSNPPNVKFFKTIS